MRVITYAVLSVLFFACSDVENKQHQQLSFSRFIEKQIDLLQSNSNRLHKRLTYNQESKQILQSKIDWKHELSPFLELSFPNQAQQKDYQMKRFNLPNNAYCLSLIALNNQAKYKFIEVLFIQEKIQAITVYSSTSSFTQHTSNYYRYVAAKNYQIESAYQIKTMAANKYVVEGIIVN